MPYWRLFYHVVWATSGRESMIEADAARVIERSMRTKSRDLGGIVHAVGWMPDHVHVAVSIPPNIAIGPFVGQMKGASSHAVNQAGAREAAFAWQKEYGVESFGERNLPDVVAYLHNQPERHATQTTWDRLERTTDRDQLPPDP
ncbi:MAG: IS200/IS605 family transposase [Thermomicrobiales bacterium]